MSEKTIEEKVVYEGKIVTLKKLTVKLESGKQALREIISHSGAVGVLAINSKDEICLVKQFRKALETDLWEIPAGKLEPDEDPFECAKRELKEETGITAAEWVFLGKIHTSPGFVDEGIYLYRAKNLVLGEAELEEDENIISEVFSLTDVKKMIKDGVITDAKTMAALLYHQLQEE